MHDETITLVAPNGATEPYRFHPDEKVEHVLKKAIEIFAERKLLDPNGTYVLAFNGTALEGSLTLKAAGVTPGSRLSVRAKQIPGDGNAPSLDVSAWMN